MNDRGRLVVACPDRPGIVASISGFLFRAGANIVHSDQHSTDPVGGEFFLRVEFDLPNLLARVPELEMDFLPVAQHYHMEWRIAAAATRKRLAIFASREDHCLLELLWRHRAGDLNAEIAMVISNHRELERSVEPWNVPFHYVPVTAGTRLEAEEHQQILLDGNADLIVLARYMQILSPAFVARWPNRIINIHHSFLPAFAGASPYRQAFRHGVKLIGATAHYVTSELDAGPIIEQDVQRVDHRQTIGDLRRIGRQVERAVLARAVIWHVEDRILVHSNKTLVFA
ncbi:MAG TPA: formyltetrahydrofolate deformylase [Thermomicrobiales bacterium]|nr:formyltetrahydrofolate deformylase [Thermomicrobiales bacterium]